jgi:hypothetical protein
VIKHRKEGITHPEVKANGVNIETKLEAEELKGLAPTGMTSDSRGMG